MGRSTATPPPVPLLAKAGWLLPQSRIAADRGRWICIREACRADVWRAAAEGRLLAMLPAALRGRCSMRHELWPRSLLSQI